MKRIKWTHPDIIEGLDSSFMDQRIARAIIDMSQGYDELTYEGHMDGHHFVIERIINHYDDSFLSEKEIADMYYTAFGPEAISIDYV